MPEKDTALLLTPAAAHGVTLKGNNHKASTKCAAEGAKKLLCMEDTRLKGSDHSSVQRNRGQAGAFGRELPYGPETHILACLQLGAGLPCLNLMWVLGKV